MGAAAEPDDGWFGDSYLLSLVNCSARSLQVAGLATVGVQGLLRVDLAHHWTSSRLLPAKLLARGPSMRYGIRYTHRSNESEPICASTGAS